jgi:secreted trypsin-like serine protease
MLKKFNLTLAYFLLGLFCFNQIVNANRIPKIVGGRASDTGSWPWMVALSYNTLPQNNDAFCGATLIAKDWVLTAAHCVVDQTIDSISVVTPNQTNNESLLIKQIVVHPSYNAETFEHDLALIELAKVSQIFPIKILSSHTIQDRGEKEAIALGWGTVSAKKAIYPVNLQQVNLTILDSGKCSNFMGGITENMICAGDKTYQKDTCQGDSGGPLIVFDTESNAWRQAGITSWGYGCAQTNSYGVYTRLKNYADFISTTICSNKKDSTLSLGLTVEGHLVTATWTSLDDKSSYRLNYALFSKPEIIYSLDMNKSTEFSINLPSGSAYFVTVSSYIDNCLGDYSNTGTFHIQ